MVLIDCRKQFYNSYIPTLKLFTCHVTGQGDERKPTNGTSEPAPAPQHEPEPAPPVQTPEHFAEAKPEPKQAAAAMPSEPERAEPPKRVRVPPGGFSSGLW